MECCVRTGKAAVALTVGERSASQNAVSSVAKARMHDRRSKNKGINVLETIVLLTLEKVAAIMAPTKDKKSEQGKLIFLDLFVPPAWRFVFGTNSPRQEQTCHSTRSSSIGKGHTIGQSSRVCRGSGVAVSIDGGPTATLDLVNAPGGAPCQLQPGVPG
jgi:hypothetical protein